MNMKPECTLQQGFGQNVTSYAPLLGHPAIDNSCGYGTPIHSYWDSEYVYKVLGKDRPANDGSGFTGVFTIVEQDGLVFEFLYGHCNPTVFVGQTITKGTVIGTEANNGEVYSKGFRITLDMQRSGDRRGSHRHDQARKLRKDKVVQPNTTYLSAVGGGYYQDSSLSYYAIPDYKNGFNGCFDWTKIPPKEFTNMMFAVRDYQVSKGILDFKYETNPQNIKIGPKTLKSIAQDSA